MVPSAEGWTSGCCCCANHFCLLCNDQKLWRFGKIQPSATFDDTYVNCTSTLTSCTLLYMSLKRMLHPHSIVWATGNLYDRCSRQPGINRCIIDWRNFPSWLDSFLVGVDVRMLRISFTIVRALGTLGGMNLHFPFFHCHRSCPEDVVKLQ